MKKYFSLLLTAISLNAFSQTIEMPLAGFKTGDDINFAKPDFDDSQWQQIKSNVTWELQGFDGYNGFAWYRFHVTIPTAIKTNSLWKDSLRIHLAKIDDLLPKQASTLSTENSSANRVHYRKKKMAIRLPGIRSRKYIWPPVIP